MRLIPREEKFYRFFRQQAKLYEEAAELLCDATTHRGEKVDAAAEQIRGLEHDGDAVIRDVSRLLRKTFITPLDPEDIHRLAELQDDLLDEIEECSFRLSAYRLDPAPNGVATAAGIVREACRHLAAAVEALEQGKPVNAYTEKVKLLEIEADKLLRAEEADLFSKEKDPIVVMKQKVIIDTMEAIADRCEDVADVLENIVIKNS